MEFNGFEEDKEDHGRGNVERGDRVRCFMFACLSKINKREQEGKGGTNLGEWSLKGLKSGDWVSSNTGNVLSS